MELKKVRAKKASQIATDIELSEEAAKILSSESSPAEFLQSLLSAQLPQDAIRFLARGLPHREATWWACLSARQSVTDATTTAELQTLEFAETWVFEPTDENRYAANAAADSLSNDSPIYWSALASFWSGGSLAPPDVPAVEPAANICSMAVAGAVTLAALSDDPEQTASSYNLFIRQGVAIANGENAKEITA